MVSQQHFKNPNTRKMVPAADLDLMKTVAWPKKEMSGITLWPKWVRGAWKLYI